MSCEPYADSKCNEAGFGGTAYERVENIAGKREKVGYL